MVQIAKCESGNVTPTGCVGPINPNAANPHSSARGVFQILIGTWHDYGCEGSRYDVDDSIECARKIYDARGTQPWNASKHNWGKEA